jgi:hypothetical protein
MGCAEARGASVEIERERCASLRSAHLMALMITVGGCRHEVQGKVNPNAFSPTYALNHRKMDINLNIYHIPHEQMMGFSKLYKKPSIHTFFKGVNQ